MLKTEPEPQDALEHMCHMSKSTWVGTVYTIADDRFPDYNGRKILQTLNYGKHHYAWLAPEIHKGKL